MSALPPHLRASILEAARKEPSPTRAQKRTRALAAGAAGALASLAVSAALGGPTDARRALAVAFVGVATAISAFVATWLAASRGASMMGRPTGILVAVATAAPLVMLAWTLASTALDGAPPLPGETMRSHVVCFVFTLIFATGPFAALAYARRGSDPVHPRALGAALGGAAGAWGAMFIDVHCAFTSVVHLTLGHAAPIAALAALGALLGESLFGVRRVKR